MKRNRYYYLGTLLVVMAIVGMLISVVGILGLWWVEQTLKAGLQDTLVLLDTTLQATGDGLAIAGQSLGQANTSLAAVVDTLQTSSKSVHDAVPLVDSLGQLTTKEIPNTIAKTQQALQSAQTSARIIDSTLKVLTSLPLLPVAPYASQLQLGDALQQISASLDPISRSLSSMDTSFSNASQNLAGMEERLNQIAAGLKELNPSLADAKKVTAQYEEVISTLKRKISQARSDLPGVLDLAAVVFTILLVWLGLAQVGLLVQGLEMMGRIRMKPADESDRQSFDENPRKL